MRGFKHVAIHLLHIRLIDLIVIHAMPDRALVIDRGHKSL